jgi:hypothetical protein
MSVLHNAHPGVLRAWQRNTLANDWQARYVMQEMLPLGCLGVVPIYGWGSQSFVSANALNIA